MVVYEHAADYQRADDVIDESDRFNSARYAADMQSKMTRFGLYTGIGFVLVGLVIMASGAVVGHMDVPLNTFFVAVVPAALTLVWLFAPRLAVSFVRVSQLLAVVSSFAAGFYAFWHFVVAASLAQGQKVGSLLASGFFFVALGEFCITAVTLKAK